MQNVFMQSKYKHVLSNKIVAKIQPANVVQKKYLPACNFESGLSGHNELILQDLLGFIGVPGEQLKSFANSSDNINDPISRYLEGVCSSL